MILGCPGGNPCLHGCHATTGGCRVGSSPLHGRRVETYGCAVGSPNLHNGHVLATRQAVWPRLLGGRSLSKHAATELKRCLSSPGGVCRADMDDLIRKVLTCATTLS